jgi:hypothetical protein
MQQEASLSVFTSGWRQEASRLLGAGVCAWFAGFAMPLAMVAVDPIVFRSSWGSAVYGEFRPFGYVAIGCGTAAVAVHLLLRRGSAVLAGVLAASSVFAGVLGLALLPLSILGVFFLGIGLLGLTPFVSSFIVGWRARMAFRAAKRARRVRASLGFLAYFGLCAAAQWRASSVLDGVVRDVCSGRPELVDAGIARLARWELLIDVDQLIARWAREEDEEIRQQLEDAYQRLTGDSIERRMD